MQDLSSDHALCGTVSPNFDIKPPTCVKESRVGPAICGQIVGRNGLSPTKRWTTSLAHCTLSL